MEIAEIFRDLAADGLPVEAIRTAQEHRAALAPAFVQAIERYVAGDHADVRALFLVFHLLGEWRERSAYRPLAALLRLPRDDVREALGDGVVETGHRVMAAVFDGDPAPLHAIIRDPQGDEFVRARMCEALAMVTLRGEVPREATAAFLRDCFHEVSPQDECFVWDGWQSAIAMLGLVELVPLVRDAFERGFISRGWLSFEDFQEDIDGVIAREPASRFSKPEFDLFGDTVEELSSWSFANPTSEANDAPEEEEHVLWRSFDQGPAVNPYRDVGRNDPCPCGSGKKFKKCCLDKVETQQRQAAAVSRLRIGSEAFDDAFPDGLSDVSLSAYDPLIEPDSDQWLALDEEEQVELVRTYHRGAGIEPPGADVHAMIHVVVENRIAELDEPTYRKLDALIEEGLDRHEAIHAIGSVLIMHVHDIMSEEEIDGPATDAYHVKLEGLTAESWRRDFG